MTLNTEITRRNHISILEHINTIASEDSDMIHSVLSWYIKNTSELGNKYVALAQFANTQHSMIDVQKIHSRITHNISGNLMSNATIAVKDNISVKGVQLTCGSAMLLDYKAEIDSTVHKLLKNAGAIEICRANMDEFAVGNKNDTSIFGKPINPVFDKEEVGGSSGGSGVCVAADMATLSLGTDTGGSCRIPAYYCNVVSIKPTYGAISKYGVVEYDGALDTVGIFAHYAKDIAIALECVWGEDSCDQTTAYAPQSSEASSMYESIGYSQTVLGIDRSMCFALSDRHQIILDDSIEKLRKLGFKVIDIDLRLNDADINKAYELQSKPSLFSSLSKFDGVRYGQCEPLKDAEFRSYKDTVKSNRSAGFGEQIKIKQLMGAWMLFNEQDAIDSALKYRRLICDSINSVFTYVDAILSPTFVPGNKEGEINEAHLMLSNLSGLPGVSFPINQTNPSEPFSLHLMGKKNHDFALLSIAGFWQTQMNQTACLDRVKMHQSNGKKGYD